MRLLPVIDSIGEYQCRLRLLLVSRQVYCEAFHLSLSLSAYEFYSLNGLADVNALPAQLRAVVQQVRLQWRVSDVDSSARFLRETRRQGVVLRDLLPNVKCIEYDIHHWEIRDYESTIGGWSVKERLEEWFKMSGEVELRAHIV